MLKRPDVELYYELAGIPTLVLSAEHDPIAPPRYGRMLAAAIPGARFAEMPDASHGVTIQKAEEINEQLMAFLVEAESVRTSRPP